MKGEGEKSFCAGGDIEAWSAWSPENFGFGLYYFTMTPDARAYAYSTLNEAPALYLVTGLR